MRCTRSSRIVHALTADVSDNEDTEDKRTPRSRQSRGRSTCRVTCDICFSVLSKASALRSHRQRVHRLDLPSYGKCAKCNKSFKEGRILITHERKCGSEEVDTVEQSDDKAPAVGKKTGVTCDVCMQVFSAGCALYRHKRSVHGIDIPSQGKCSKCGKLFRYGEVLARHERNCRHVEEEEEEQGTQPTDSSTLCNRCYKVLRNKAGLKLHLALVHGVGHYKTYSCNQCPTRFSARKALCTHQRLVHGIGDAVTFACNICPKKYKDMRLLKNHKARDHGIGTCQTHACRICHKVFFQKGNLKTHLDAVHSAKYTPLLESVATVPAAEYRAAVAVTTAITTTATTECESNATEQPRSSEAVKISNENTTELFTCNICSRSFRWKGNLDAHVKSKHGDQGPSTSTSHVTTENEKQLYTCDICSNSFNKKTNLARHIHSVHGQQGAYRCDVCKADFFTRRQLRSHLCTDPSSANAQTSAAEEVQCDICTETFSTVMGMQRHRRTHNVQDKKCDVCEDTFTSLKSLHKHKMQQHVKQPDPKSYKFKCDVCQRSFTGISNRNRHIREVHKKKNNLKVQCNICEETFSSAFGMRQHRRRTHNLKDNKCGVCNDTFTTKKDLKKHKMQQHFKPPDPKSYKFTCDICQRSFTYKCNMRKHIKKFHDGRSNDSNENVDEGRQEVPAETSPPPATHDAPSTSVSIEREEKKPVVTCTWSLKPPPPRHPGDPDEKVEILSDDEEDATQTDSKSMLRIQSFGSVSTAVAWNEVDDNQQSTS